MDDDLADTVVRARSAAAMREANEAIGVIDEDTLVRHRAVPVSHVDPVAGSARTAVHYRFRINDGDPMTTDLPTIIGRAPRAPRVPGAYDPRLLTVSSPAHEVSGTHLELRQQGASVVVTDLRSTNGTAVVVPGSERVALRPGESFVAGPGSIIDIGDGNLIEVLPVERLVPTGEHQSGEHLTGEYATAEYATAEHATAERMAAERWTVGS